MFNKLNANDGNLLFKTVPLIYKKKLVLTYDVMTYRFCIGYRNADF